MNTLRAVEASFAEMMTERVELATLLSDISAHLIAVASDRLEDVDLALSFPWLRQRVVVEREAVAVPCWADVPAEAAVDRASAEATGTQSCLLIPIEAGPKLNRESSRPATRSLAGSACGRKVDRQQPSQRATARKAKTPLVRTLAAVSTRS